MPSRIAAAGRAHGGAFLRFAAVGAVGFLVDAGLLMAAVHALGLGPLSGRLLSFAAAVLATYELNRRWSFRHAAPRPWLAGFAAYLGVQGLGFLCNLAVYTGLLLTLPPPLDAPLLCLFVASGIAMLVNFAGARFLVFRRRAA